MSRRLVVTGAGGALGARLVPRAVRAGWEVLALDTGRAVPESEGVEPCSVDVTDPVALAEAFAGAGGVVHLAARPSPLGHDPHDVLSLNVGGTLAVLLAAETAGVERVCLASSVNATGAAFSAAPRYDWFPVEESHPSYSEDPYAISKFLGEQAADAFARRRRAAVLTSLRFHGLREWYGPDDPGREAERRKDLWGWVSFAAASAACLRSLGRRRPGHVVANVVGARTVSPVPTAELAARFHPGVPWRSAPTGNSSFYATDVAAREFGWDAADDDPVITAAERPRTA
ncbi:NAD-dependent epimerase/dehydratase family protein [Kineococcus sp. R86509]|uniref:NAD-dependent epimerase/dehydratase family protein n=1 Tax=Kineococcus sp. R86509 TaxID=3093851 RepID=UPI0036D2E3C2